WVIKPQFRDAYDFSDGKALVRRGESGFNKADWDKVTDGFFSRESLFKLFLAQYALLGMSRSEVHDHLGTPANRYWDSDIYTLTSSTCGNAYRGVEIHYENDKTTKYRPVSFDGHGDWIDKPTAEVK